MNISDGLVAILVSGICAIVLGAIVIIFVSAKPRKFKTVKIIAAIVLTPIVFIYCASISLSPLFIGSPSPILEPSMSEIVGSYHLDTSSTLLAKKGYFPFAPNNSLNLHENGTFSTENMPDLISDELNAKSEFVTGKGTWQVKFDSLNRDWFLYLEFSELNNAPCNQSTHIRLAGRKAPYNLYYVVGDPDSHQAISYLKDW